MSRLNTFKKDRTSIKKIGKKYLGDRSFGHLKEPLMNGLSGMAMGFFVSLILGTVLVSIGERVDFLSELENAGKKLQQLMPILVGAAIAYKLKVGFTQAMGMMIAAAIGGGYGNLYGELISTFIATMIAYTTFQYISTENYQVELIILPLVGALTGVICYLTTYEMMIFLLEHVNNSVKWLSESHKWIMGPVVGLVMGMLLTLPISSAGIAFAISIGGIDGNIQAGAAMAGTSAQMISFGVITFMANKSVSKAASVGLGTSMLHFNNIIKRPHIFIIPLISSAVAGFIAVAFDLHSITAAAGMGSSSLVGPLLTITLGSVYIIPTLIVCLVVPVAISVPLYYLLIKIEIIEHSDLRL